MPAGNVLGEIGKGHKVAFNILNYGRLKLAAMCSGGARAVDRRGGALRRGSAGSSASRSPSFGAIRHKLGGDGRPRVRGRSDALPHRRADRRGDSASGPAPAAVLAALEEFAIEASILKVAEQRDARLRRRRERSRSTAATASCATTRPSAHYRDARVNRIFEGTNEINRLLIPGMLVKRALKGGLPLIAAARQLQDELLAPPSPDTPGDAPLDAERRTVAGMKKVGARWCSAPRCRPTARS